ncbi:hypothetical protein ADUPG1_013885, partial [Aduncisulcus paluster]
LTKHNPEKTQGSEGPHTFITCSCGHLHCCGTAHKGMLGNCCERFFWDVGHDELTPFEIGVHEWRDLLFKMKKSKGSLSADDEKKRVALNPSTLSDVHVEEACSAHIHSCCRGRDGKLYTWGCGSGGRIGLEQYVTGRSGKKSRMKCYVHKPTPVTGICGVTKIACFKYGTLCIADKK